MRIEEQRERGVLVLAVMESRLDARVAPEFTRQVGAAVERGARVIALDLSRVEFVDSRGLRALILLFKQIGRSGYLSMAGTRKPVFDLFRMTKLDRSFALFPTAAIAVAAMNR
ncbi:MAG: STAS domain-containing protein [Acidobacteriota bacterium]